jgi:hypothetical protein
VDAFWSITVYNADGYLEANDLGVNSYNNYSARPNEDDSLAIHFGSCDDERKNCISITPGWNYAIRMYEPKRLFWTVSGLFQLSSPPAFENQAMRS